LDLRLIFYFFASFISNVETFLDLLSPSLAGISSVPMPIAATLKSFMKRLLICCFCLLVSGCFSSEVKKIDLSGQWDFSLDRDNVGVIKQWYLEKLPEQINLPGSLQEQGFGNKPSADTEWTSGIGVKLLSDPRFAEYINSEEFKCPFWLTPDRYYVGKAWYQREVKIPKSWRDERIVLLLERPHWKTTVWVDDNLAGSCS